MNHPRSVQPPHSSVELAAARREKRLSERIFDFSWQDTLPWSLVDGEVTIELMEYAELAELLRLRRADLFGAPHTQFFVEPESDSKARFGREMDVFLVRLGGEVVGYFCGHPSDWSTYYLRSFALDPSRREKGICGTFCEQIVGFMASVGCKRIEVDTSAANVPMIKMLSTAGFIVAGTMNSARWGAIVRFAKHLDAEEKQVFARQYLCVPRVSEGRTQ
jgi:RimJ/RimL family protein N-acetyltransferase